MLERRLFLGATLAALGAGAARAQGTTGPIRIATVGPMTGQYAAFGAQMKAGAEQAVTDLNAAGGVLGRQLALEIGDDACDPRQAVSVANQMAGRGVRFIAGHFCSGSSIPASKVYAEEGVLQISPASTNPRFTDEGGWNTFRTCGRDDQQGMVAGKYIADNFKGKRIAILHDNSAYGKGLADETKKALNANGVTEVLYAAYTPGERDYSAIVSRLQQANADVVYVGGYHTESGLILRQAKERGMGITLIGGDALVTNELRQGILETDGTASHADGVVNNRKEVIQCLIAICRVSSVRPGSASPPPWGRLPEHRIGHHRLTQWKAPGGRPRGLRHSRPHRYPGITGTPGASRACPPSATCCS